MGEGTFPPISKNFCSDESMFTQANLPGHPGIYLSWRSQLSFHGNISFPGSRRRVIQDTQDSGSLDTSAEAVQDELPEMFRNRAAELP